MKTLEESKSGLVLGEVDARVEQEFILRYQLNKVLPMNQKTKDLMGNVHEAYSDEEIIDIAHGVVEFIKKYCVSTVLISHMLPIDQYLLHNIIVVAISKGIKVLSCHGRYDELHFRRYSIPTQRFLG